MNRPNNELARVNDLEQNHARTIDRLTLRTFPLGWKRSYWPEPRLGKPQGDWSYRKPRTIRKSRWQKMAEKD